MPFTFAHPAIVLPLFKRHQGWFLPSALVVGSMVPDFEYFLRLRVIGIYGHTLGGVFWFDLPLGLLLLFVFHLLVKKTLIINLPRPIRERLFSLYHFHLLYYGWQRAFAIILSLLIGIASHLFWDAFTHGSGYFAQHIEVLSNNFIIGGHTVPGYKFAQHGSTLLGVVILVFAFQK